MPNQLSCHMLLLLLLFLLFAAAAMGLQPEAIPACRTMKKQQHVAAVKAK
jgi:hypothetical protein